MVTSAFALSYLSIFYNNARTENVMDYIIMREIGVHTTKFILGIIFIILILIFGPVKELFMFFILFGIISATWLGLLHEEIGIKR